MNYKGTYVWKLAHKTLPGAHWCWLPDEDCWATFSPLGSVRVIRLPYKSRWKFVVGTVCDKVYTPKELRALFKTRISQLHGCLFDKMDLAEVEDGM